MSWDSHLLLFELDPARAHHLERQLARDRRVHVNHGDAARRHLLNSRALDAHFRRNRGDLREIHLHITDRL